MTTIITGTKTLNRKTAAKIDRAVRALGAHLVENAGPTGNRWWVNAPASSTQETRREIRQAAIAAGAVPA